MADPNLILTLTAINPRTTYAFEDPHNENRLVPPTGRSTREESVSTNPDDGPVQEHAPQLRLTFDRPPRDPQQGWVFGNNRSYCDIWIGCAQERVSSRHFRITFNLQGQVILRDNSLHGTTVVYNEQCQKDNRSHFTWILLPEIPDKEVKIDNWEHRKRERKEKDKHEWIYFRIDLAHHEHCEGAYYKNLLRFLGAAREAVGAFDLTLQSKKTTAHATGAQSPNPRPVYYAHRELGRGFSGIVYLVVDVSTGTPYAKKDFFPKTLRARGDAWRKEIEALKELSHVRIDEPGRAE